MRRKLEQRGAGMSDRTLIFNAKGVQIGYIEADRAFDLAGKERCKYARATGNLSGLDGEEIVGHVSLDGTFAGLSWISEELFGKPTGEVHPGRAVGSKQRPRYRAKQANLQRPEKRSAEEPKHGPPWAATESPQPEKPVEESQSFARSGGEAKTGLNASEKAADEAIGPHPKPPAGAPDQTKSSADDELLGRAIA